VRRSSGSPAKPLVSVLTPTLALERADFLRECEASVNAQTWSGWEHLILNDKNREGCAITMNRLAREAQSDWFLPLADDDLLLPGCLETLLANRADADVIYAPPLVTGNEDRWWFFQSPPAIPSCALIRADLWDTLGGYDETRFREEDRDLWVRALAADAKFVRVDEPCWVYRQHTGQKSFQAVAA
jgi:glycosyltransferase involved in cell wall biosynthesis